MSRIFAKLSIKSINRLQKLRVLFVLCFCLFVVVVFFYKAPIVVGICGLCVS